MPVLTTQRASIIARLILEKKVISYKSYLFNSYARGPICRIVPYFDWVGPVYLPKGVGNPTTEVRTKASGFVRQLANFEVFVRIFMSLSILSDVNLWQQNWLQGWKKVKSAVHTTPLFCWKRHEWRTDYFKLASWSPARMMNALESALMINFSDDVWYHRDIINFPAVDIKTENFELILKRLSKSSVCYQRPARKLSSFRFDWSFGYDAKLPSNVGFSFPHGHFC